MALTTQPTKAPKEKWIAKSSSAQSAANSDNASKPKEPTPTPSSPTTSQPSSPASDSNAASNAENVNIQRRIEIFTGVLAGVGALQLVVMFLTWMIYRRQALEMRRQRHEMRSQRHVMFRQWQAMRAQLVQMERAGEQTNQLIEQARKQAEQLTVAAEAARNSAEAAKMNAKVLVNSERAWVLVNRVGNPKTWYDPSNPAYTPGMIFELRVFGRTPATLANPIFHLDNIPAKPGTQPPEPDLPAIPEYKSAGHATDIPQEGRIVAPGGEVKVNLWFKQQLTEQEWVKLRDGQTVMCAYGIVKYKDAFGNERETRTCYVYDFAWGGVMKAADGFVLNPPGFRVGGPSEYNRAT